MLRFMLKKMHSMNSEVLFPHVIEKIHWTSSVEQTSARNVELNSSLNRLAIMHNSSRPPSAGWCCSVQGVGWQCGLHSGHGLGFFKSVTCQQEQYDGYVY